MENGKYTYNSQTLDNDIAIVELAKPISFTDTVWPAALPAENSELTAGTVCTVSGWGTTSSGEYQVLQS